MILPPVFGTPRGGGVGGARRSWRRRSARCACPPPRRSAGQRPRPDDAGGDAGAASGRGLGIVTSGKALPRRRSTGWSGSGISLERAGELGHLACYKVAMTYPLEPEGVLEFVDGLDEVLVVEPKYPLIEDQVNRLLRRLPARASSGARRQDRRDTAPRWSPSTARLDATSVSPASCSARIERRSSATPTLVASMRPRAARSVVLTSARCRRRTTPEDDPAEAVSSELVRCGRVLLGVPAQHVDAGARRQLRASAARAVTAWRSGWRRPVARRTCSPTWAARARCGSAWRRSPTSRTRSRTWVTARTRTPACMAIRAAIAADVNMTFKVLLNGYISMTGGQAIPGGLSAQRLGRPGAGRGGARGSSSSPTTRRRTPTGPAFPDGVDVRDRDVLIETQEELQRDPGRHRADLRPGVRRRAAPRAQARQRRRSRTSGCSSTRRCARAAATATCSRTASPSSRWRPSSGASGRSTSPRATRTSRASTGTARASSRSTARRPRRTGRTRGRGGRSRRPVRRRSRGRRSPTRGRSRTTSSSAASAAAAC